MALTNEEIHQVVNALKADAQGIGELAEATSLENVNSLPAIETVGEEEQMVQVWKAAWDVKNNKYFTLDEIVKMIANRELDKTIIEILKIYKSVNQEDTVLFKKLKDKKYSIEKAENIINYSHEFYSQQDMHDKKELSEYIHFLYNLVIKNKSGKKEVNAVKKI